MLGCVFPGLVVKKCQARSPPRLRACNPGQHRTVDYDEQVQNSQAEDDERSNPSARSITTSTLLVRVEPGRPTTATAVSSRVRRLAPCGTHPLAAFSLPLTSSCSACTRMLNRCQSISFSPTPWNIGDLGASPNCIARGDGGPKTGEDFSR
jgi:hypothetical protein